MTLVRSPTLALWSFVVGIAVSLGVLAGDLPGTTPSLSRPGLYAIISIVAAAWPIIRRILTATLDIFEPILPGCVMLLALFGIRPLVMLYTGDITYQHTIDVHAEFNRATLIGMLATISFVVGYEILSSVRVPRPKVSSRQLNYLATTRAVRWLVAVGALAFLLRLASAGNPLTTLEVLAHGRSLAASATQISNFLNDGPLLAACGATILVIALRGRPTVPQRIAIVLLIVAPLGTFFLLGNRRLILPSVLTPIIVGYMVRGQRPAWRHLAIVLPVAFIVLATIPFERSLGAREEQGGAVAIFDRAFKAPFEPIGEFFTSYDTAMVPDLGLEVSVLQRPSDYYFGRATIGDLLLAPIPSALIPGKPQTARNSLLIRLFGQGCVVGNGSQCPDFSVAGTFYQDFWLPGIVVGMLILGAFSAALWARFCEARHSALRIILAASWAISLPIIIRGGFMPPFQWWLEFVVPTWVAVRYIEARSRPAVKQSQTV